MNRLESERYCQDVEYVADLMLPWEQLAGKTVLISGASGMIGSFFIDVIMRKNVRDHLGCSVIALTRNEEKAKTRATAEWNRSVRFVQCDINKCIPIVSGVIDYMIHAASNTHPVAYATDPIGTIASNIIGTQNMLESAAKNHASRCIFVSSVEIYGENRGDIDRFNESYCGYLDCNTLRAGYPEGKRAGEAMCQAYISQKNLDVVIVRLPRVYGPTMLPTDTKAVSQFIQKGVKAENIVLKSEGKQLYSYCYAADAVAALLHCLFFGKCGAAYNVADPASDITLKDLAELIATIAGTEVVYSLPSATERAGYSKATKALMDGARMKSLGWHAQFTIANGIDRTIRILRDLKG